MIVTIIVFLLILSILVLIHEFGHFIVAKRMGIKVEEFGFGFPPKVFSFKRGETVYSINLLPFGGFVKLYGEDEAGGGSIKIKDQKAKIKDTERAFFSKSAGQRALVTVAGVVMNTLLAIVVFYAFLMISGFKTEMPRFFNYQFFGVNQINKSDLIIDQISKNSPADKAGIKPIAKIVAINNQKITSTSQFVKLISENKGKEVTIKWQDLNTNKEYSAKITPRVSPPKGEGALGVAFGEVATMTLDYKTPMQKIFSGITHPLNLLVYNIVVLEKLIASSFEQRNAAPLGGAVAGPIGIGSLVGLILQLPDIKEKVLQILNLVGMLSISLAFFNVLPIPALDGGRLFFVLIEFVTKRKIPSKYESLAHAIGFAFLLTLLIVISIHDIAKFIIK